MKNMGVNRFILILTLSIVLSATNCATLTRKRTQPIPVTSSPASATILVNGQPYGVTPLEVLLVRKNKGQVIRIESPGYHPVEIRMQRKRSAGPIIGNFFLGVIPGTIGGVYVFRFTGGLDTENTLQFLIWSLSTAAFGGLFTLIDSGHKGFELAPKELVVTLTKSDGPPRVDTIFIDAEDLYNIKWIRVHRD